MDTNKLHIFSKNTDAFASQRGYNYQTLITLEAWVNNLKNGVEEDIFCEYEEDIFHKNKFDNSVKFRQIKLYSTNFSFKSEEIIKCIAHFFMLHVKSEYYSFDKEFVFETNSDIARAYSNNEADLLREWFENQDNLSEEQATKISQKVKEIVTTYIKDQEKTITKEENEEIVKEAISVFEKIDDEFWVRFIKLIKWKFLNEEPDVEFENVKSRIEDTLLNLNYKIDDDNVKQAFGVLLERVFTKASQEKHDDRKLTSRELDLLILNIGDEEDKWYSGKYEYYSQFEKIDDFRIGEFYEIIDLVNYCRRKRYLIRHKETWNKLIDFYVNDKSVEEIYKRKAIYELIFLNNEFYEVDYENLADRKLPTGDLKGFEDIIRYYFRDISTLNNSEELEECQNILNILLPHIIEKKINISSDEQKAWIKELYKQINNRLSTASDSNDRCKVLELKGNFLISFNPYNGKIKFLKYFEEILSLIDKAPLFNVSQFGDRVNKYIKIFINVDPDDKNGVIKGLEEFSEKLYPFVEKREGKARVAKQQVEKGVAYLNTKNKFGLLKALESFHKAKDNYQHEDTIEGFVLALLNISQLYNSIGMHFAGKYYALGAFRMSVNKEFVDYTEKSLAGMFYSDYKQGSWFNAFEIYDKYIYLRNQSNLDSSEFVEEGNITHRLSFILYYMQRTSLQCKYFIEDYISHLGYIGNEIIKPNFSFFDTELNSEEKLNKILENKIDDFPLNDIGEERIISFYALGSLWKIRFENSYNMTAIAEEYIATIQIVLAEISLSEIDFHLLKSEIEIELIISEDYKQPVQQPSNEIIKWKVSVCFFDTPDTIAINKHTVFNTVTLKDILNNISLLKQDEFDSLFFELIKERGLDTKQISVNLYQRIHRDIYLENYFKLSMKTQFQKEDYNNLNLPKENAIMVWNNSLSNKYDNEKALKGIENRFNNSHKCIYLTLEKLKKEAGFSILINELRNEGWKDWQIIMNIFNFIINYKIKVFEKIEISEDEDKMKRFRDMMIKYKNMDEKDCYIDFPLEAFKTEEFKAQLRINYVTVLNYFGLESKSITPNFEAIKEFLDVRFNFKDDNFDENNPLQDIPFE